jgi:hypothetical protein
MFMQLREAYRQPGRETYNSGLRSGARSGIKEQSARGIIVACGCGMDLNPAREAGI